MVERRITTDGSGFNPLVDVPPVTSPRGGIRFPQHRQLVLRDVVGKVEYTWTFPCPEDPTALLFAVDVTWPKAYTEVVWELEEEESHPALTVNDLVIRYCALLEARRGYRVKRVHDTAGNTGTIIPVPNSLLCAWLMERKMSGDIDFFVRLRNLTFD